MRVRLKQEFKDLLEIALQIAKHITVAMVTVGSLYLSQYIVDFLSEGQKIRPPMAEAYSLLRNVVFIIFGFSLLITIFNYVITLFRKGSTKVKSLKEGLQNAFIKSLEDSPLNPKIRWR